MSSDTQPPPQRLKKLEFTLPTRAIVLPSALCLFGFALGLVRGGRTTSLRFLAENAHRPPRTKQARSLTS